MQKFWVCYGQKLLSQISQSCVPSGTVAIWYLGQAGFVVKGAGVVVYIDPWFTDVDATDETGEKVSKRKFAPPFAAASVQHADVVLATHNHLDHMDVGTLRPIADSSPNCRFVAPAPAIGELTTAGIAAERVIGARVGTTLEVGPLRVTPVPAHHDEPVKAKSGDYRCLGYVLQLNGVTLYHAGDTFEYPEMIDALRAFDIDVACLPINGDDLTRRRRHYIGNINFREAADIGHAIGAKLLVPMHYDMFAANTENPAFFIDYLYRTYPAQPAKVLVPGERLICMP